MSSKIFQFCNICHHETYINHWKPIYSTFKSRKKRRRRALTWRENARVVATKATLTERLVLKDWASTTSRRPFTLAGAARMRNIPLDAAKQPNMNKEALHLLICTTLCQEEMCHKTRKSRSKTEITRFNCVFDAIICLLLYAVIIKRIKVIVYVVVLELSSV